jgi:hypothetical protein
MEYLYDSYDLDSNSYDFFAKDSEETDLSGIISGDNQGTDYSYNYRDEDAARFIEEIYQSHIVDNDYMG